MLEMQVPPPLPPKLGIQQNPQQVVEHAAAPIMLIP